MKYIKLIVLLFTINCVGQSDYIVVENKYDKNRRNGSNIEKYDSIKNVTTVNSYQKLLKLNGKWLDFNREKFLNEDLVSHAYMVVGENDIILEYATYTSDTFQHFFLTDDFQKFNKKFLRYNSKNKSKVISTTESPYKNYFIHKIKRRGRHNKNNYFTTYTLLGKKNDRFYWFTLYNIDDANFENFDKLLIDTFNNN